MNTTVLIPAAGVGRRFGASIPKQYVEINGKTILQHTVDIFAVNPRIQHIVVVVSPSDPFADTRLCLPENGLLSRVGGESRAETVWNGLRYLLEQHTIQAHHTLLVHDAVRCCLPQNALNRLLDAADYPHGALLAIPVSDTLKRENAQGESHETVSRSGLWQAQTPQLFPAHILRDALAHSDWENITDEASAVEKLGLSPLLVLGDSRNLKLTRPDDARLVRLLLSDLSDETERKT